MKKNATPTQSPEVLASQIAAIEAEQRELFAAKAPIDARLRLLYEERGKLVEQAAAHLDPGTDEGLKALWQAAWDGGQGNSTASDKLDAYAKTFAPEIYKIEWLSKDGNRGEVFPAPRVMLTRGQSVDALSAGLLTLLGKLSDGRTTAYVPVFEHTSSQFGVYGIDVDLGAGTAVLHKTTHGHRDDLFASSLANVLARTARDHWFEREPGASDEDEPDEDRERGW